jgi:hypothetical protein
MITTAVSRGCIGLMGMLTRQLERDPSTFWINQSSALPYPIALLWALAKWHI